MAPPRSRPGRWAIQRRPASGGPATPAFGALLKGGGASLRDRWRERAHPHYVRAVERAAARPVEAMTDAELLAGAVGLLDAGTTYYTAVQTIIPLAVTSESTKAM